MPKFIYTITIFTILLWAGLIKFLTSYKPEAIIIVLGALLLFFIATSLTFSLAIFFIKFKKDQKPQKWQKSSKLLKTPKIGRKIQNPESIDYRKIYRNCLKIGTIISLVGTVLLGIRTFANI